MKPTIGRIVHYLLSANDAKRIVHERQYRSMGGNAPQEGDEVPLIIVRVWPNEYGDGIPGVNGQAFLDGDDSLWVCSAREGTKPGTWHWPDYQYGSPRERE